MQLVGAAADTSHHARRVRTEFVPGGRVAQQKLSSCSTPTEGVDGHGELRSEGMVGTGELRSGDHDLRVSETARAVKEKARLNRNVCESERSHETAGFVKVEHHVETLGPTDWLRELKLMQSRDELSGEESLWGDIRAGAGYAREIDSANPELFRERAESRGLFLLSENGGDEPDAHCRGDQPRPERPLGRVGVFKIHDKRDRLQHAFGRAGLEGRAALHAGLRQRDVLRQTSRLDAFGHDLGRWCAREHRSG